MVRAFGIIVAFNRGTVAKGPPQQTAERHRQYSFMRLPGKKRLQEASYPSTERRGKGSRPGGRLSTLTEGYHLAGA